MKHLLKIYLVLCAAALLAACGSDGEGGEEASTPGSSTPKTYSKSVTISYEATTQVISLDGLSAKLTSVTGATDWLRIEEQSYSSGTPGVKVIVGENLTLSERKANLTATASTGDRIIVNVTQQAHPAESNTGSDDSHDNVTDQPANAPRR